MSARELQRVVVRMHHDPEFAAAVSADPERALADVDVTTGERALLGRPDPRAWGVDPARRDRVLEALRREFEVTCALAEGAAGRGALLGFFSSPSFHGAIQERRLLVVAFGEWLAEAAGAGRLGKRPTAEVAALEAAAVAVRRAAQEGGRGPSLVVAPWVRVVRVREGALDLHAFVFRSLREAGRLPSGRPRLGRATESVAVERLSSDDIVFGRLPPALAQILDLARVPVPRGDLVAEARRLGADPREAEGVVDGLVADRLLTAAAG